MEKNDLNASSFAEAIQVGRSSISHILSGRNKPSLDLVMNIVDRFPEVDLYWLLNGKGTYPKTLQQETLATTPPEPIVRESQKPISNPSNNNLTSTPQDLFTMENEVSSEKNIINQKGKNISKIIILYSDGSFKDYVPE